MTLVWGCPKGAAATRTCPLRLSPFAEKFPNPTRVSFKTGLLLKKTIVMMLDTSGSMTNNSYGENRLAMLKNGMNAFLASNNPVLN
jgi:hypothetical protein